MRKKKEAGAYECVAENGNGDPVSATADLTVFEGDEIWIAADEDMTEEWMMS